ncbi:MAG: zinc ribbon domain-containing protein [Nitrolancea sp.]
MMSQPDVAGHSSDVQAAQRYYGWALSLFAVGLVGGILAMFLDSHTGADGQSEFGTFGTIGLVCYLCIYGALIAINFRGYVRALAAHRWLNLGGNRAVGCVVAVLLFFFIVPFVLFLYPFYGIYQYARGYNEQRKRYPLEHQKRVAELEAQLGIPPVVDGVCPSCGKPLQVDAEFCSFCGVRVHPEVRACPKCGTVALPGAEWCAKCGSSLSADPASG